MTNVHLPSGPVPAPEVLPGKDAEFTALLHDVGVPINQARANAGELEWYVALRGVVPAGSSATCEHRIVYGYKGLPPEEPSPEKMEAAMKAARVNLTLDQLVAKRQSVGSLVATEVWQGIDKVGPDAEKGSYVRINHYHVKNGAIGDWVRLEQAIWKPLMEAWLKEGGKGGWRVGALMMPSGDVMPYNASTVDIFPDWNGLIRGWSTGAVVGATDSSLLREVHHPDVAEGLLPGEVQEAPSRHAT